MVFSCVKGPLVCIASMHAVCVCIAADWHCLGVKQPAFETILAHVLFTACKTLIVAGHIVALLTVVACRCVSNVDFSLSLRYAFSQVRRPTLQ